MPFMDYAESGLSSAAQGAASGFMVGGPVGAAIGGGVGLLEGIFNNPEDVQRQRYKMLQDAINQWKNEALTRGMGLLESSTQRRLASGRAAATRRAAAIGRSADVESFAQPIETTIGNQGAQQEENYIAGVNEQAGNALMGAAQTYAQRPIQPSLGDTLLEAGSAYSQYKTQQAQQGIMEGQKDALQKYVDKLYGTNGSSPSNSMTLPTTAPPISETGFGTNQSSPMSSRRGRYYSGWSEQNLPDTYNFGFGTNY